MATNTGLVHEMQQVLAERGIEVTPAVLQDILLVTGQLAKLLKGSAMVDFNEAWGLRATVLNLEPEQYWFDLVQFFEDEEED